MRAFFKIAEQVLMHQDGALATELFEAFYSHHYGSLEKAQEVFSALQASAGSEAEFQEKLNEKIAGDLPVKEMQALNELMLQVTGFNSLVNLDIENWVISNNITQEKFDRIVAFMKIFEQVILQKFNQDKEALKAYLKYTFASKIMFSIKETREELMFKNQKTFKKWLNHFYPGKFDNRRYINILEYADIMQKFILHPDETSFDFENKLPDYQKRLNEGLIFPKSRLKKFTRHDYKLLQAEFADNEEILKLALPKNADFFPYSIAQNIIKHLV